VKFQVVTLGLAAVLLAGGCSARSFFDPSKTGAYRDTPTTIPVLDRLDVIEPPDTMWSRASLPTADDLVPIDLVYRLVPGDVVTVSVYELVRPGVETVSTRRIEASGVIRITQLGDIPAAGLTIQELQDAIWEIVNRDVVVDPQVNVVLEEGGAFTYTVYGSISGTGLYTLRRGDFRLLDALAAAGGAPLAAKDVFVIRQVSLDESMQPRYQREPAGQGQPAKPVDVDDLIDQLGNDRPNASPGAMQVGEPMIDIDDLEPIRQNGEPMVDVDTLSAPEAASSDGEGDSFIYVPERNEWVRVKGTASQGGGAAGGADQAQRPMALERVIRVPLTRLQQGESALNLVIRPYDKIYVEPPMIGVVYIEGEIVRPGVFNLPSGGDKITLSRLISAAGGFSPLAIPERVDVTREVGENLEATITLDLAAIRSRTQPDVILKPNDHIIVGTAWFATPLAILRNGFRMTYGFGFLLDRNFGNDVFGAPPSNRDGD